jgi:hypothetical protein
MPTAVRGGGAATGPALMREAEDGQLCGVQRGSLGRASVASAGWAAGSPAVKTG